MTARVPQHSYLARSFPLIGLLLYYAGLGGVSAILIAYVPGFRGALAAPIHATGTQLGDVLNRSNPGIQAPVALWDGIGGRGATVLVAMVWAMALVIPVVWVLMRTRRLRYDPSLVHTLLALPLVVAGIVIVVKNSLALAFALAGIVAGVRFRQKLEEPEEAVYVLLALGIGLAAGVQALDIAMVMSMVFSLVVMTIWRYDLGAIYAHGRGAQLAVGDPALLSPEARDAARDEIRREPAVAGGMKPDGLLLVRAPDPAAARRAIESVVSRCAAEWRITEAPAVDGLTRIDALLTLKPKADPADLIAELEARWSDEIAAAEYVPLGQPPAVGT